jgi:hypothetical protein
MAPEQDEQDAHHLTQALSRDDEMVRGGRERSYVLLIIQHALLGRVGVPCKEAQPAHEPLEGAGDEVQVAVAQDAAPAQLQALDLLK